MRTRCLILLMTILIAGCQRPVVLPGERTLRLVALQDQADRDRLWTAAEDVLRNGGYPLALTDWREGRLETEPVSSQHFFEAWRTDVATNYDLFESSLLPLRRRVEVLLVPLPNAGRSIARPESAAPASPPSTSPPTGISPPDANGATGGAAVAGDQASTPSEANNEAESDKTPAPGVPSQLRMEVRVVKEQLSRPDRQFNQSGALFQFFGSELPATTGQPRLGPEDERWIDRGRDRAMERYWMETILRRAGLWERSRITVEIPRRTDQERG